MERERRTRSLSPTRDLLTSTSYTSLPPRPARPASASRIQSKAAAGTSASGGHGSETLTVANLGHHMDNAEKVIVGQELKMLRGALMTTKSQLQEAEKDTRQMREKAEEARSELMLLDFKRTTATKDLSRLLEDLERKKAASQRYDQELEAKRIQLSGLEALGLSNEEGRVLQEENAGLRQRQRGLEALQLERDELGRQLEAAKGDLLREQRQARLHKEEMSEEMETLMARLDETQHAHVAVEQQLLKLEAAYRKMEREKNELIQEQSKEYNALKSQAVQESKESRQLLSKEVELLNKELQSLQVRFGDMQSEVRVKDEANNEFKEQVAALTNEVAKEQAARVAVTEDHRRTLQMLRKETDSAMLQLRESLFLDKQRAMEELRAQVEQERRSSSARTDERMAHVIAENAQLLEDKNQEISRLQDQVRDLHELLHSAERRIQDKTEQQVRDAVARERAAIDKETEWKMRNERETLARDTKQRFNEMQMAFDHERETNQRLNREIAQLKEELEEQKRLSREAAKEKLVAVAKTKDQLREQTTVEVENAKEKVRQEMQREVDRVQGQLKTTEEELRGLRADNQRLASREREHALNQDRTEKTVINEINEECRRSASVLGVSPRQIHLSNLSESGSNRSQITSALANLRAVNEELRKHVQELTSDVDRCRSSMAALEKEKEDSLESARAEMEKQRTSELDKLKEQLMKEHREELSKVAQAGARQTVANSMINALRRKDGEIEELKKTLAQGREQAAEKYAHLYKAELAQELEKSQELLHRSNQEQKQINDIQQREISRLEKEVQKLALALSGSRQDYLSSAHPGQPTSFTDTALDLYLQMQNKNDQPAPASLSQQHHHHHPQAHHQHHHPQVSQQQQQQQLLQARIKQLNSENNALRRKHLLSKHNVSVPDLTSLISAPLPSSPRRCLSPGPGEKMRSLEERLRQGEKEALKAEERARLKQTVMSEKMAEMNKLQNTLASQNQELLKLEQAYSQLHRQYNNSPSLAVASILNSTR